MVSTDDEVDGEFEIVEYCGRLSCHRPIVQTAGRGRRREFCSETCRRGADRDYKRAKALVEHFEQGVTKLRHEVAAYGRKSEADGGLQTPADQARTLADARVALERAETVLEYTTGTDERLRAELDRLVTAFRPLVGLAEGRATA